LAPSVFAPSRRSSLQHTVSGMGTPQSTGPTVIESYRNFEPPSTFKLSVETLLGHVPAKYLVGLKSIVLTNRAGLTRDERRQKVWSRKHKVRLVDA
jgi:hypothetical protein